MEKFEMMVNQKVLSYCAINNKNEINFLINYMLIKVKAENVELFGAKEARYLNELVFGDGRSRQRNEANEIQLKTMNALQLANIKLINKGVGTSDRMIRLRDFKELM